VNAIELEVEKREETGSAASRRMRKQGYVPAVIYCDGAAATNIKMNYLTLNRQIKGTGRAQLFVVKSEMKELNDELVLIRDMDIHPLRQEIQHVDLLHIQAGVRITVSVPIEIEGVPADVKAALATIEHAAHEIEVECLPREIPNKFVVNISELAMGDTIHAVDVPLPEGFVLKSKDELMVVTVIAKRAEKAVEEDEVETEAVEGAAPAAADAAKES